MNEIILGKLNRIEAKLDAVIKALHEYDDDQLHCEYSGLPSVKAYSNEEYGESSFEAFQDEAELNKRMDIIGQNGNEGIHYRESLLNEMTQNNQDMGLYNIDEFDDYGKRVNKNNNTQTKHTGKKKYNNKYHKKPNTPVTPKQMNK